MKAANWIALLVLCLFAGLFAPDAAAAKINIKLTFKTLGDDKVLSDHGFWLLERGTEAHKRQLITSDENGQATIEVEQDTDIRLFSTGTFFIPYSWSRIREADLKAGEKTVYARTMETITISGKVSARGGKVADRATVQFAPLDVQEDGSFTSYDRTYSTRCNDDGSFEIEMPAGYYDFWANWLDDSTENWDSWFYLRRGEGLFASRELEIDTNLQPRIEGKVIDGRNGKPISARVDLVSTAHLSQTRLAMRTDKSEDENELGEFSDQLNFVDQNHFSVVVKAADSSAAIRVYPNLSLEEAKKVEAFKIYDPSQSHITVSLKTKAKKFPLTPGSIRILPSGTVDAPSAVREDLLLLAYLDDKGEAEFWGLPKGTYAVYTSAGKHLLGDIQVDGGKQAFDFEMDLSFVYGSITYPDGSNVEVAEVQIEAYDPQGNAYPIQRHNPLRNIWLKKEKAFYMVPLGPTEIRYVLTFGATDKGKKELPWDENTPEMKFVSKPIEIRNDKKAVQKVDIKLHLNPQPKVRDD